MLISILALVTTAAGLGHPDGPVFAEQARAACAAPVGDRPQVEGVRVEPLATAPGDLPGLKVVDTATGGWMTVYHDPASEAAAHARAACLGSQLALLAQAVGDQRRDARWASVVFTTDPDYIPPRDGVDTRWTVATTQAGGLDKASRRKVVAVIPHEQVHDFQKRAGAETPRWFHEGHAEWVGRRVTAVIDPEMGERLADQGSADLAASTTPVDLMRWGGISVKPEAILRQVSAADRERMMADPTWSPPGPFTFGPDDMQSDESNMAARYQAAWTVFDAMERAHGGVVVRDWVRDVTSAEGRVSADAIQETAKTALGEDIVGRLETLD